MRAVLAWLAFVVACVCLPIDWFVLHRISGLTLTGLLLLALWLWLLGGFAWLSLFFFDPAEDEYLAQVDHELEEQER